MIVSLPEKNWRSQESESGVGVGVRSRSQESELGVRVRSRSNMLLLMTRLTKMILKMTLKEGRRCRNFLTKFRLE